MSELGRHGQFGYSPSTEYRDNYGQPKSEFDYAKSQGAQNGGNYTQGGYNPRSILTRGQPGAAWDPNNPRRLSRALPMAPFIPDPLPYPEPHEPYFEGYGPSLQMNPIWAYSSMPLSARDPLPPYVGFAQSYDWENLVRTPLPRNTAPLFAGERRVDGMRSWMDMTHLDGHVACDGLCPWCSTYSPGRSMRSRPL